MIYMESRDSTCERLTAAVSITTSVYFCPYFQSPRVCLVATRSEEKGKENISKGKFSLATIHKLSFLTIMKSVDHVVHIYPSSGL